MQLQAYSAALLALFSLASTAPAQSVVAERETTPITAADLFGRASMPNTAAATFPDGSVVIARASVSGDPLFEVFLPPPISGSPTEVERFLIQIPLDVVLPPFPTRPAVVGFHFFGVSEASVFNQTLPQLCQQKGWYLIAPLGFNQVNFGNRESQDGLDAIFDWVEQFVDLDDQRLYGVGFSMGGLNALSYAWRHQNPSGRRFAAVASLLGTVDPVFDFENGTPMLQSLLANPLVFGGTPDEEPFNYARISPARLSPTQTIDDLEAPVNNLLDTRVYLGINLTDPTTDLLTQNFALSNYLQSKGFQVTVDAFSGVPVHAWSSFDQVPVIDFFDGSVVPGPEPIGGPPLDLYLDREDVVRFTEIREIEPETVARFRVTLGASGSNSFALEALRGVGELVVDASAIGIDPAQPLTFSSFGENPATPGTRIVLPGYPLPPAQVTVNGVAPAFTSHDAATGELTVQPRFDSVFSVTTIIP